MFEKPIKALSNWIEKNIFIECQYFSISIILVFLIHFENTFCFKIQK